MGEIELCLFGMAFKVPIRWVSLPIIDISAWPDVPPSRKAVSVKKRKRPRGGSMQGAYILNPPPRLVVRPVRQPMYDTGTITNAPIQQQAPWRLNPQSPDNPREYIPDPPPGMWGNPTLDDYPQEDYDGPNG